MDLSSDQRIALAQAQAILEGVGLASTDLESLFSPSRPPSQLSSRSSTPLAHSCQPSPAVLASRYIPPPARPFTQDEIKKKRHKINDQKIAHEIIVHEPGVIVEYPQTGDSIDKAVAHIFPIDPDRFENPKDSFQYSLGNKHGGRPSVNCNILGDDGEQVLCHRLSTSCRGLKVCSAHGKESGAHFPHSYVNREQARLSIVAPVPCINTAKAEVFMKTLALFCSLTAHGCMFGTTSEYAETGTAGNESDSECEVDSEANNVLDESCLPGASELVKHARRSRRKQPDDSKKGCKGTLVMRRDSYNRYYISCQYRSHTNRAHLILRNLQEYDIDYLHALLTNDMPRIAKHELSAMRDGYGPRVPCTFTASPSEQKQCCPHWHRFPDGTLAEGALLPWVTQCPARFLVYIPHDLRAYPRVAVICISPHSHAPPPPVKTPPPLEAELSRILHELDWRLADATPRRVMLDSGFVRGLRNVLGWVSSQSPSLSDLHPSYANLDHAHRLIMEMRLNKFPHGTQFEGVAHLVNNAPDNPRRYIRCAEKHKVKGGEFELIVCMSPAMSLQLMHAKRLSIDMSFKRVNGKWEEFEIETWDNEHMRSIVVARAFTTCESAEAHQILFSRIFKIAQEDTGLAVSFHYINGHGIQSIVADGHKGQARGLGMFCESLCRGNYMPCRYEPRRRLCDLGPYDHLRRMYRLCTWHFRRNVHKLRTAVSSNVQNAMRSISSFDAHPDFENTLRIIKQGGKKAKDWLRDKEDSIFTIPALYYPRSLMPPEFWKACPTTTNGNEQSHRNINRDGINLTLLGGVMHGRDYDERVTSSLSVHSEYGIHTRDNASTHARRVSRTVSRTAQAQQRQFKQLLSTIDEDTGSCGPRNSINTSLPSISTATASHYGTITSNSPSFYEDLQSLPTPRVNHTYNTTPIIKPTTHLSTYSTLANALTPGISVVDYQSFTVHTSQASQHTNSHQPDTSHIQLSRYSELAGALGGN